MRERSALSGPTMSSFELYLRFGKRPSPKGIDEGVEVKFNPWHDPDDGRFTFKQQGDYHDRGARQTYHQGLTARFRGPVARPEWQTPPTRPDPNEPPSRPKPRINPKTWGGGGFTGGGGGRFGGGGATGNWGVENSRPHLRKVPTAADQLQARDGKSPTQVPSPASAPAQHSQTPSRIVQKNGYRFEIDTANRTRRVSGRLSSQTAPRSKVNQRQAGGSDRRVTDDGGHYVAARFNGPSDAFNHFAQDANFNRGRYRTIENDWASALRSGQRVQVSIVPHYRSGSQRPYEIDVSWTVNNATESQKIPNERSK